MTPAVSQARPTCSHFPVSGGHSIYPRCWGVTPEDPFPKTLLSSRFLGRDDVSIFVITAASEKLLLLLFFKFIFGCVGSPLLPARAFSSCGEQGLLFVVVRGLLIAVASLVVEHGL